MDNIWIVFLVIGCFAIAAQAQAEEVFPDYWQDEYAALFDENQADESKVDETINNDNILHGEEFVDENGDKYNIDEVINSALAEGLNDDEVGGKNNDNFQIDEIANDNVNNEEQVESVVNSDETRVREEIESFRKELAGVGDVEKVENEEDIDGNLDDYQFEDNRSEVKEDVRNDVPSDSDGSVENQDFDDNVDKTKPNVEVPAPNDEIAKSVENEDVIIKYLMPVSLERSDDGGNDDENNSNAVENEETNNGNENIQEADIDETNQEDSLNSDEDQVAENVNEAEDIPIQEQIPQNDYDQLDYEDVPDKKQPFVDYIDGIQEDEIQKFLVEKDNQIDQDTFDEQNIRDIDDEQEFEPESDEAQETVENLEQDEDTVDKVKADLNEDLERLFDTWNKLSHDSEEHPGNIEQNLGQGVEQNIDEGQDQGPNLAQLVDEGQDLGQDLEQNADESQDLGQHLQQHGDEGQDLGQNLEQYGDEGQNVGEGDEDQDLGQGDEEQDLGQNLAQLVDEEHYLGQALEQNGDEEQDLGQSLEQHENEDESAENVEEYENKYGKPYGEDIVLAQREEGVNMDSEEDVSDEDENVDNIAIESNLGDILVQHNIAQIEIEEHDIVQNIPDEENPNDEIDEIIKNSVAIDENSNVIDESRNIVAGASIFVGEKQEDVNQNNEDVGVNIEIIPEVKVEDVEKLIEAGDEDKKSDVLSNGTDEINDFERISNEENIQDAEIQEKLQEKNLKENDQSDKLEAKSVDVLHLTSTQYDDLMRQFAIVYSDDIEMSDEKTEVSTIDIDTNTPVTITSPNYPEPYPADVTVDYYFHGEGIGIELNITDLELNGATGDYLLIKPGSSDETGSEGLIFSYHLTEPRTYRFLDVDQLFVRFRSNPGVEGKKGFSYSVKMVAPLPNNTIPDPSPAPLLPPPATLTVYLGGLAVSEFMKVTEQFKMIVADMATMYINSQGIDAGRNTTSEVTQITSVGYCNVNWPSFDVCVQVSFGVPLVNDDTDENKLTEDELYDMWSTLFYRDPFAYRLRQLNIEEFSTPNDRVVLRSWLVVASGVVLSAAMLAFVLWRFSCFQGYTRMSQYSDTDSIQDVKRNLDLYPTPHQTLPPLYTNEYQWADDDTTRVDMGGFANRSYTRDELFDIESDEDTTTITATAPKDRYTSDV